MTAHETVPVIPGQLNISDFLREWHGAEGAVRKPEGLKILCVGKRMLTREVEYKVST